MKKHFDKNVLFMILFLGGIMLGSNYTRKYELKPKLELERFRNERLEWEKAQLININDTNVKINKELNDYVIWRQRTDSLTAIHY